MKSDIYTSSPKENLARCKREHAAAVTALAEAEAALGLASGAYDAALGQGREAALAARRAQSDAEVDRDVARRTVEVLAISLDEARTVSAAAEAERLIAVARERITEFGGAAKRDLKTMTGLARKLARLHTEAEIARTAALRAGANEEDLPGVEAFRNVSGFPGEVIETGRVERWMHPTTGQPLDDEQSKLVRSSREGNFLYGGQHPMQLYDRHIYDRTVSLAAQAPRSARSILSMLAVPGLMADDVPGWSPPNGLSPHAVLAHLDALEGAPAPDRSDQRERRVHLRRVLPAELAAAEMKAIGA